MKITHAETRLNPINNIARIKLNYKTINSITKASNAKICYTDFWSENMKTEVLKMGRIDALESFSGVEQPQKTLFKKEEEETGSLLSENFKNRLLSRERLYKSCHNENKKPKSKNTSFDISYIVDVCNQSRTQNKLLKKSMHKTSVFLKKEFNSIMKRSASTNKVTAL